jgi:hypothetical protein
MVRRVHFLTYTNYSGRHSKWFCGRPRWYDVFAPLPFDPSTSSVDFSIKLGIEATTNHKDFKHIHHCSPTNMMIEE